MEGRLLLLAGSLVILLAIHVQSSNDVWSECNQTEYSAYRSCVHNRLKRQSNATTSAETPASTKNETDDVVETISLPESSITTNISSNYIALNSTAAIVNATVDPSSLTLLPTCTRLNYNCLIGCANDTNCENKCPKCPLNAGQVSHDYQTVVLESIDGKTEQFQARIEAGRNVTTIIRLTNIINNTNTIHIPTNVTTTNLNNVHVHNLGKNGTSKNSSLDEGGDFGLGVTEEGPCCIVVRARSCSTTSTGPKCQHRKHKTCDSKVCTAKIMHAQYRRRCNRKGDCQKKVVYIPEPGPQKCVQIDQWPYVVCGKEVSRQRSCDGCYDHYGYGFENYHSQGSRPECSGCFDGAWDQGQRYRRGPVLRPYYYHQPPCYLMGTCVPEVDCGYGCYGDEFVDPAWGRPVRRPSNQDVYYEDELDDSSEVGDQTAATNGTNSIEDDGDWVEEKTKCKVVGQNGTIISNCTENSLSENEFAKEPNVNLVDDLSESALDEFDRESRFRRHAMQQQYQPYVPAGYRPINNRRSRPYLNDNDIYDSEEDDDRRVSSRSKFADDDEYDAELEQHRRAQRSHRRQRKNRGRKGRGRKGRDGSRGRGQKHSKKHEEQPAEEKAKSE